MSGINHWQYFDYRNIMQEAKARLTEARQHGIDIGTHRDTLEYWIASVAHANAMAVALPQSPVISKREENV